MSGRRPDSMGEGFPDPTSEHGATADASLGESFPRHLRIVRQADFQAAFRRGFRHHGVHLIIHLLANELPHSRLGMAVPRKVGGAVRRNRLRRRLREVFRRRLRPWLDEHVQPADVVVRGLPGAADCSVQAIEAELREAVDRWQQRLAAHRSERRRPRSSTDE